MRKINLIVGDLLKSKKGSPTPISRFQASLLNIITYFSSHSVAPGSLRKEIDARPTLGKERTLIRPGITRWTSHYAAAGRVWELHDAYQALQDEDKWRPLLLTFGVQRRQKTAADKALQPLTTSAFWREFRSWASLRGLLVSGVSSGLRVQPETPLFVSSPFALTPPSQTAPATSDSSRSSPTS